MDAAAAAAASPALPLRYLCRLCVSPDDVNLPIPCNRSGALSSPAAAASTRTHVCRLRTRTFNKHLPRSEVCYHSDVAIVYS